MKRNPFLIFPYSRAAGFVAQLLHNGLRGAPADAFSALSGEPIPDPCTILLTVLATVFFGCFPGLLRPLVRAHDRTNLSIDGSIQVTFLL